MMMTRILTNLAQLGETHETDMRGTVYSSNGLSSYMNTPAHIWPDVIVSDYMLNMP